MQNPLICAFIISFNTLEQTYSLVGHDNYFDTIEGLRTI